MKLPSLIISLLLTAAPAVAADDFQPEPGFISLFNGQDLTGWCYREENKPDGKVIAAFDGQRESTDARYSAGNDALIVHPKIPRQIAKIWTQAALPENF